MKLKIIKSHKQKPSPKYFIQSNSEYSEVLHLIIPWRSLHKMFGVARKVYLFFSRSGVQKPKMVPKFQHFKPHNIMAKLKSFRKQFEIDEIKINRI